MHIFTFPIILKIVFSANVAKDEEKMKLFLCPPSGVAVGVTFPPVTGRDYCHSTFEDNEHWVRRLRCAAVIWASREEEERVMDRERGS